MKGHSNDISGRVNRTSVARNRIAQVVAGARMTASLDEPSRPVTPLELDQRTSLTFNRNPPIDAGFSRSRPASSQSLRPNILRAGSGEVEVSSQPQPAPQEPSRARQVHTSTIYYEIRRILSSVLEMMEGNSSPFTDAEFLSLLQQFKTCVENSIRHSKAQDAEQGLADLWDLVLELQPAVRRLSISSELKLAYSSLILKLFLSYGDSLPRSSEGQAVLEVIDLCCHDIYNLRTDRQQVSQSTDSLRASGNLLVTSVESLRGLSEEVSMLANTPDIVTNALSCLWKYISIALADDIPLNKIPPLLSTAFRSTAYCAGVLRAVTSDETERKRMLVVGTAVQTLVNVIHKYHDSEALQAMLDEEPDSGLSALLVQVVGVLRNISLDGAGRKALLELQPAKSSAHTVTMMCGILERYRKCVDVQLNIARVLAKVSSYHDFRVEMSAARSNLENMASLINNEATMCKALMNKEADVCWPGWSTWPLISRICFTLANLTNSNEKNRAVIGMSCDCASSIELLLVACSMALGEKFKRKQPLTVFQFGMASQGGNPYSNLDDEEDNGEAETRDAVIKLVRLMANLSIDSTIGDAVAKPAVLETLLSLLVICDNTLEHEEMLLNVMAALTNLSYYSSFKLIAMDDRQGDQRLLQRIEKIFQSLAKQISHCLFHENNEIVLETARVLGNLTRRGAVVKSMTAQQTHQALLLLLQHQQHAIVSAVLGTLINISSHPLGREALLIPFGGETVIERMCGLLKRLTLQQLPAATMICQVLCNTLTSSEDTSEKVLGDIADTLEVWMDAAEDVIVSEVSSGDADGQLAFSQVAAALQEQLRSAIRTR